MVNFNLVFLRKKEYFYFQFFKRFEYPSLDKPPPPLIYGKVR